MKKITSEQLETYLAKLVAMQTVEGNNRAQHECIEYLASFFSEHGLSVTRYEFGGQESLVATSRGTKTPKVMLAGHIDVIPAKPNMYQLKRQSGKLIGRGVLDMKSAIAVYMAVVDALDKEVINYDFGIMITSDEEVAGKLGTDGAEYLIKQGYIPEVVVLPDGGGDWQMETSCKGYLHYTVEAKGKSGHGSRPWLSDNAAYKLMDALHALRQHFASQGPHTSTLNVGVIHGGEAPNKVPDYLSAEIDVRPLDVAELDRLLNVVPQICEAHSSTAILRARSDPVFNSLDNPYLAEFAELITKYTGVNVTGMRSFGGSDARFFTQINVPCAVFYPFGAGHHSDEEWIAEEALMQEFNIVMDFLNKAAQMTVKSISTQAAAVR